MTAISLFKVETALYCMSRGQTSYRNNASCRQIPHAMFTTWAHTEQHEEVHAQKHKKIVWWAKQSVRVLSCKNDSNES